MPSLKQDLETIDKVETVKNNTLASLLQLKTTHGQEYLKVALANVLLFDRKQQDYGPHNIAKLGTYGVIVRMSDKLERIIHLFRNGRKKRALNESTMDSFRDMHVYAGIAQMTENNMWPTI